MVYRKPFTLEQWRAALREYESFHDNVRELRTSFPPMSKLQRRAFKQYRDAVRSIGKELQKGLKLRVGHLNIRIDAARNAMVEYFRIKQLDDK